MLMVPTIAIAAGLLIAFLPSSPPLKGVAVAGATSQVVLAIWITFGCAVRPLSVVGMFCGVWTVYFPFRLAMLSFSRPSVFFYESVNTASDEELKWIWLMLTLGFAGFGAAVYSVQRRPGNAPRMSDTPYGMFLALALMGIVITLAIQIARLSSGLTSNFAVLGLFGVAGASFIEQSRTGHRRQFPWSGIAAVLLAILGYRTGFKEASLLPIAAWLIGRAYAGQRVKLRYIAIAAISMAIAFAAVQGQRAAFERGTAVSSSEAIISGFTEIDLASGADSRFEGLGIAVNVIKGTLFRLKGADYLIVVVDRVPNPIKFQAGKTLWQPPLSILPGYSRVFDLDPDYRQLSLGRLVTTKFTSFNQPGNRSSQSLTYPGDFYLNFGWWGVTAGMVILGLILQAIDRLIVERGAMSAGLIGLIGPVLVAIDRNIAYTFVTAGLRIGILMSVYVVLNRGRLWQGRRSEDLYATNQIGDGRRALPKLVGRVDIR